MLDGHLINWLQFLEKRADCSEIIESFSLDHFHDQGCTDAFPKFKVVKSGHVLCIVILTHHISYHMSYYKIFWSIYSRKVIKHVTIYLTKRDFLRRLFKTSSSPHFLHFFFYQDFHTLEPTHTQNLGF